jgi:hypothetical protein
VTYGFTSGGCDWRPMKDVDARDKPGHDAGRADVDARDKPGDDAGKAIGNHSRDNDASCKRGSATATVAPALSLSPSWPGEATKLRFAPTSRPSTSFYVERLCVARTEFTPRLPATYDFTKGPQTGRQGRGWPGRCPAMTERVRSLAMLGTRVMARRGNGALLRRRPVPPRPVRVIVPYSLSRSGLPARMSLGFPFADFSYIRG